MTDVTGRGNPLLFQIAVCFCAAQRRTDCHVASLLATAAYHDSLTCRLVPLGAMTGWFKIDVPICTFVQSSAFRDGTEAVPCTFLFSVLAFFSHLLVSQLRRPPFPSVRTGDCLAAARSRRGSDMPPACHSLPRRRCTTLVGAALRGKDLKSTHDLKSSRRGRPPCRPAPTLPRMRNHPDGSFDLSGWFFLYHSSSLRTARKASVGIWTVPSWRIFFLPSFCFSKSFFLRVISPP